LFEWDKMMECTFFDPRELEEAFWEYTSTLEEKNITKSHSIFVEDLRTDENKLF